METLCCDGKLQRALVQGTDTDMLCSKELGRLRWDLELTAGWKTFEYEAQQTGEPVELVVAHSELGGQVWQEYSFVESVSTRPDFTQADATPLHPVAVSDDDASQRPVSHPSPGGRLCHRKL